MEGSWYAGRMRDTREILKGSRWVLERTNRLRRKTTPIAKTENQWSMVMTTSQASIRKVKSMMKAISCVTVSISFLIGTKIQEAERQMLTIEATDVKMVIQ